MSAQKAPQPANTQLRVGRLTKAHGLKGAIKVELYTDAPERRFVPGAVFALQVPVESEWHGKTIELSELKWYNSHPVAFFKNVSDRSAAESLIKAILWIDQDLDEPSDEEDAWFDHHRPAGRREGGTVRRSTISAQDLLTIGLIQATLVPFRKRSSVPYITAGTIAHPAAPCSSSWTTTRRNPHRRIGSISCASISSRSFG